MMLIRERRGKLEKAEGGACQPRGDGEDGDGEDGDGRLLLAGRYDDSKPNSVRPYKESFTFAARRKHRGRELFLF